MIPTALTGYIQIRILCLWTCTSSITVRKTGPRSGDHILTLTKIRKIDPTGKKEHAISITIVG